MKSALMLEVVIATTVLVLIINPAAGIAVAIAVAGWMIAKGGKR